MGNHETMPRQPLDASLSPVHRAIALGCWLSNGGRDVLGELGDDGLTWALVEQRIGADRVGLLARMGVHHRSGGVAFVHAGFTLRAYNSLGKVSGCVVSTISNRSIARLVANAAHTPYLPTIMNTSGSAPFRFMIFRQFSRSMQDGEG